MQQVVYLIVALAVAAAVLSIAAAMKAVLPAPEAPLEHAEALVYVKVKPLNGSYWLGVHAPYGDVEVRQVRVGNVTYVLDVTAPVGRDVWLNASGKPITARCGDSVELVTARGVAARSLAFTVQCPTSGYRVKSAFVVSRELMRKIAESILDWYMTLGVPRLAVTIDPMTDEVVIKNIGDEPLFVVGEVKPGVYPGVLPAFQYVSPINATNLQGSVLLLLAPGEEYRFPQRCDLSVSGGAVVQEGDQQVSYSNPPKRGIFYVAVVNVTDSWIYLYVNGLPYNITADRACKIVEKTEYVDVGGAITAVKYKALDCGWDWVFHDVVRVAKNSSGWWLAVWNWVQKVGPKEVPIYDFYKLEPGLMKKVEARWLAPWCLYGVDKKITLYAYPVALLENATGIAGAALASATFARMYYAQAFLLPNGTYVAQWISQTNSVDARSVLLRPGERLFVQFNLTWPRHPVTGREEPPVFIDFGRFQIRLPHYTDSYCKVTAGVPLGLNVTIAASSDCHVVCRSNSSIINDTIVVGGSSSQVCEVVVCRAVLKPSVGERLVVLVKGPDGAVYNATLYVEEVTLDAWGGVSRFKIGVYLNGSRLGHVGYRYAGGAKCVVSEVRAPTGNYGVYLENLGEKGIWVAASPATEWAEWRGGILYIVPYDFAHDVLPEAQFLTAFLAGGNTTELAVPAAVRINTGMAQVYTLTVGRGYYTGCTAGGSATVFLNITANGETHTTSFGWIKYDEIVWPCGSSTSAPCFVCDNAPKCYQIPELIDEKIVGFEYNEGAGTGQPFKSGLVKDYVYLVTDTCTGETFTTWSRGTVDTWINAKGVIGIYDSATNKYCGTAGGEVVNRGGVIGCK